MRSPPSQTRVRILRSALKQFAERGYAAASVQDIVNAARVTKPALYYYFPSKAKLYAALVDHAHDERHRLLRAAAAGGGPLRPRLTAIVESLFAFTERNAALMRLAFASAFAARGELPEEARRLDKGRRNYEFFRQLIAEGQQAGELDPQFDSDELAFGLYGQITTYVMVRVLRPECRLDGRAALRVVDLFLQGAAGKDRSPAPRRRPAPRSHVPIRPARGASRAAGMNAAASSRLPLPASA